MSDCNNSIALDLKNVCVNIPVSSKELKTIKKALLRALTGGGLHRTSKGTEVKALSNICCRINNGERIALIGHNGSGKTTFLRTISGIYAPTTGSISITCNVHPMITKTFVTGEELSGAQAVKGYYLINNKSLDGYDQYIDDIINFSELGDFIHLPMKGYSEGMKARLLFALLTSGKHDCLALDEGFGTGDARFFRKAQERLQIFLENAGTLILASHSNDLLRQFCKRGLVFEEGRIIFDGPLEESLHFYHETNI